MENSIFENDIKFKTGVITKLENGKLFYAICFGKDGITWSTLSKMARGFSMGTCQKKITGTAFSIMPVLNFI